MATAAPDRRKRCPPPVASSCGTRWPSSCAAVKRWRYTSSVRLGGAHRLHDIAGQLDDQRTYRAPVDPEALIEQLEELADWGPAGTRTGTGPGVRSSATFEAEPNRFLTRLGDQLGTSACVGGRTAGANVHAVRPENEVYFVIFAPTHRSGGQGVAGSNPVVPTVRKRRSEAVLSTVRGRPFVRCHRGRSHPDRSAVRWPGRGSGHPDLLGL